MTLDVYRQKFGARLDEIALISLDKMTDIKTQRDEALEALERGFGKSLSAERLVFLTEFPQKREMDDNAMEELLAARSELVEAITALADDPATIAAAEKKIAAVQLLRKFKAAGFSKINPEPFGLESVERDALNQAEATALNQRRVCLPKVFRVHRAASERLNAALGFSHGDTATLFHTLQCVAKVHPLMLKLREEVGPLTAMLAVLSKTPKYRPLQRLVLDASGVCQPVLARIREVLQGIPYPFEHATTQIDMAGYAVPDLPQTLEVGKVLSASQQAISNLFNLYAKAMGRLMLLAEGIESELGLELLQSAKPQTEVMELEET